MIQPQEFFKSAFSVDNVIFGFDEGDLKILLIKRGTEPFHGMWALPGDLVNPDEDLDIAANRVLTQLTGLHDLYLEQVKTFGKVNRHPLGRVITIAYYTLVNIKDMEVMPSSFANQAQWHAISDVAELAFDHKEILEACMNQLKYRVRHHPVGFELLPPYFTLTEIQHLYEAILETELDKRNFRKKILSMHLIIDANQTQERVAHRPAKLYRFDKDKYEKFVNEGYTFAI